jgi:hypothetical protein
MKKALWIILAVLVIIQFINSGLPETSAAGNKDLAVAETVPSDVMELMKNACYDCHSMETTYPWYSHVAPVKWLVKSDILGARHHVNFTNWAEYDLKAKLKKLDDIHEEIEKGDMPPSKYTMMHANARLTGTDRQKIISWADSTSNKYSH